MFGRKLGLNLLLTSTLALTSSAISKAQACFSFKAHHEHYTVRTDLVDQAWNAVQNCEISDLVDNCDDVTTENTVLMGEGVFGGFWCTVGYSKEEMQQCISDQLEDVCNNGFGTFYDVRAVGALVVGLLLAGILIAAAARRRHVVNQRSIQAQLRDQAIQMAQMSTPVVMMAIPVNADVVNQQQQAIPSAVPQADQQQNDAQISVPASPSNISQPGARPRRSSFSSMVSSFWNTNGDAAPVDPAVEAQTPAALSPAV